MNGFSRFTDPHVESHLISDEGERIIDEVRKHWAAVAIPILELAVAAIILLVALYVNASSAWIPFLLAAALGAHAGWKIWDAHMDRFVVTNMRVFRVHGILSQHTATMPLIRILDVDVNKPLLGRLLGYGHFVFETAAQEQGLRDIRFVGNPDDRDLTIQRVIQRSGVRGGYGQVRQDGGI